MGEGMKRSEMLVRAEVAATLLAVGHDMVQNFRMIEGIMKTIADEEMSGYDLEKLRNGAAHMIDTIEELLLSQDDVKEPRYASELAEAAQGIKKMREDLATV